MRYSSQHLDLRPDLAFALAAFRKAQRAKGYVWRAHWERECWLHLLMEVSGL